MFYYQPDENEWRIIRVFGAKIDVQPGITEYYVTWNEDLNAYVQVSSENEPSDHSVHTFPVDQLKDDVAYMYGVSEGNYAPCNGQNLFVYNEMELSEEENNGEYKLTIFPSAAFSPDYAKSQIGEDLPADGEDVISDEDESLSAGEVVPTDSPVVEQPSSSSTESNTLTEESTTSAVEPSMQITENDQQTGPSIVVIIIAGVLCFLFFGVLFVFAAFYFAKSRIGID
jgi:hypothetical protein